MMQYHLNLPNILTLSRIPCLFVVVSLLCASWAGSQILAFGFFLLGSLTDWLDGFLARRYGMISNFGRLMDALTDKVFIVGSCVAFLSVSILPSWGLFAVLIIITREFFVTGLRLVAATQGRVIAAEKAGKLKTITQMVSLSILLGVRAAETDFIGYLPVDWLYSCKLLGYALFLVATVLTIYSGLGYLIRYGDLLREK